MEANKPVLILERNNSTKLIREQAENTLRRYTLSGTFTEFNTVNRNNRIYTAEKFLPHMQALEAKKAEIGILYGEFDHPDTFDIAAQRISHTIESMTYNEEAQRVEGKIRLLSTYWGKEARAIIDDECPLFVSSRAAGVTESNGTVSLRTLYTYDIVADPGFASARMYKNNITEQCGLNESFGAAVFDMTDITSVNDLFEANANDVVTKQQLEEYGKHLLEQMNKLKGEISEMVKTGNYEPAMLESKVQELGNSEFTVESIVNTLNYLKKKNSILMKGYKNMTGQINKIDGTLESSIKFTEHVAENVKNNIKFTEHVAQHLQENIQLTEDNVRFTEYVARNTKDNIEKTNEGIKFIEYVAEHAKATIDQNNANAVVSEGNAKYLDLIAEKVDGLISYSGLIAEKLNKRKAINEAEGDEEEDELEDPVSYLNLGDDEEQSQEQGAEITDEPEMNDGEQELGDDDTTADDGLGMEEPEGEGEIQGEEELQGEEEPSGDFGYGPEQVVKVGGNTGTIIKVNTDGSVLIKVAGSDEEMEAAPGDFELIDVDDNDVEDMEIPSIDTVNNVIEQAKTVKNTTTDPAFFTFMNSSQKEEFNSLPVELKSKIVEHMNSAEYFSSNDVKYLIAKAMDTFMTVEEMLVSYMPDEVKPVWESFGESRKEIIFNAAKLYNVNNREKVESFCRTKVFETQNAVDSKSVAVSENLSEAALNQLYEHFDRLDS